MGTDIVSSLHIVDICHVYESDISHNIPLSLLRALHYPFGRTNVEELEWYRTTESLNPKREYISINPIVTADVSTKIVHIISSTDYKYVDLINLAKDGLRLKPNSDRGVYFI